MKSGVYLIRNTVSGREYVGSSADIDKRWSGHKSDLRRGVHANRYLQNAWNKYGADQYPVRSGELQENAMRLLLLCIALFASLPVFAAPSISGTSGTWSHGGSVTINGSSFGTKSTAAPLIWDDASGASITDKWDGYWPTCDSTANTGYRSTQRGVAMPHNRVTKYIAGAHGTSAGYNCGQNVLVWKYVTINTYPTTTYISYYTRNDPAWQFADALGSSDNNHKLWTLDDLHDVPYGGQDTTNIQYLPTFDGQEPGQYSTYDGGTIGGTTRLSTTNSWSPGVSPFAGWVKREIEYRHDTSSSGYIKVWDNGTLYVDYGGRTAVVADPDAMTVAIGGYSRNYPSTNNWRYFSDVYYDQCNGSGACPRVLLCQNSTFASRGICEVQRASSWSTNSIIATVNAGRFADASIAYLYVCDSAASCNSTGTSIVIAAGGGDATPPVVSDCTPSGQLSNRTSTTMACTTDESATCKWSSTAGVAYASMANTFSTTGATSHSTTLTGLSGGASYSRYVRCSDAAGNANTSDTSLGFSVNLTFPPNLRRTQ